jgi:hypothetical protein
MTSADDIADFIALCERSDFRSRDEILDGIRSKSYVLTRNGGNGVPARRMLETYSRRSKHVGQFAINSKHAEQMVRDIDGYVRELENATDDLVKVWNVTVDNTFSYSIFEGTVAGKVLGCLYAADRRTLTSKEWDALWGEVEK